MIKWKFCCCYIDFFLDIFCVLNVNRVILKSKSVYIMLLYFNKRLCNRKGVVILKGIELILFLFFNIVLINIWWVML